MDNNHFIIITLKDTFRKNGKEIVSPKLYSLDDVCDFVKEQCEAGAFNGPDHDDGRYTGGVVLKDEGTRYRISIGRHESESRTNCRMNFIRKDESLADAALVVIKTTPESYFYDISIQQG